MELVKDVAAALPLLGSVCVVGVTLGIPIIGRASRAVFVGVHSKLFGRPTLRSVRTADVAALSARIDALPDKFFIEVFGDKGVGKTAIVETATAHRFGVVHMTVDARQPRGDILDKAFRQVARVPFQFMPASESAKRVAWWHRLIFRCRPIIVLSHKEQRPSSEAERAIIAMHEKFTELSGAARNLADCGFLPIIDASSNSIESWETGREVLFQFGPMTKELLLSLPQFQVLFDKLREAGLLDAAWGILGGVPIEWAQLNHHVRLDSDAFATAVKTTIVDIVKESAQEWDSQLTFQPYMAPVHALFTDTDTHCGVDAVDEAVVSAYLKPLGKFRPIPDKVLRMLPNSDLEPATPIMAVVLRLGLTGVKWKKLTFDGLIAMMNESRGNCCLHCEFIVCYHKACGMPAVLCQIAKLPCLSKPPRRTDGSGVLQKNLPCCARHWYVSVFVAHCRHSYRTRDE
jgi:hypothetical protein